jgi:hypothetical protein
LHGSAYLPAPLAAMPEELPVELPRIFSDELVPAPLEGDEFMSLEPLFPLPCFFVVGLRLIFPRDPEEAMSAEPVAGVSDDIPPPVLCPLGMP